MTIYELIQELAEYPADADVTFTAATASRNLDFEVDVIDRVRSGLPVVIELTEVE